MRGEARPFYRTWPWPNQTLVEKWSGVYFGNAASENKRDRAGHVYLSYKHHPYDRRRPVRPIRRSGMLAPCSRGVGGDPPAEAREEGLSHGSLLQRPYSYAWHPGSDGEEFRGPTGSGEGAHLSQTMKPKHFGSPPLRRQCEATAAKAAATGFTPALLGKPLPLGRGWGRQGEPRERCARKESISRKTWNPRGG